jgi:ABC-type uncharacterized transport system ATPase subunit
MDHPGTRDGPPVFELEVVSRSFGDVKALQDVSLKVLAGEVHCLLGENGAGKSTLCNVAFGVIGADKGLMKIQGRPYAPASSSAAMTAGVGMVHQHFSLLPDQTVLENLMIGSKGFFLRPAPVLKALKYIASEYGITVEPDLKVEELSVGERQRVEIVKCLLHEPRVVILDEPTAVLPPKEVSGLLEVISRMSRRGCGVLLITHKLAEIRHVADRCTVMRSGRVVSSTLMCDTSMDALVNAMVGHDVPKADDEPGLDRHPTVSRPTVPPRTHGVAPTRAREAALQLDGLSYSDRHGVTRVDAVTLEVQPGEIVGVAGVEGNGQSELAAMLAGLLRPTAGRIHVNGRELTRSTPGDFTAAGVAVVPEDRHATGCIAEMTVADNLLLGELARFTRTGFVQRGAMLARAKDLMAAFDIRASGPESQLKRLSGGNQQKVVLARELSLPGISLMIAAQPTRGLDVGAVRSVYSHIRRISQERAVGVLLLSSELDELIEVASRIVVMYRGRLVGERVASLTARLEIGAMMSGEHP